MKKIVVMVGPPGSGKTTYCQKYLTSYKRISQDDMGRKAHFLIFLKELELGHDLVVDRMNFNFIQRQKYLSIAKSKGYETRVVYLTVDYETCLNRLLERRNHPTIQTPEVAEIVLKRFFSQFEAVSINECDLYQEV